MKNWLKWKIFRARLYIENRRNRAYDASHNVETGREELLEEVGVLAGDVKAGNEVYRVTWGWLIKKAMAQLDIDPATYSFIDYGSGKGKAMFMASDYSFKSIIGLEFAPLLHEIAKANCQSYVSPRQKCRSLEPVLTNVLEYTPPRGPIVCFMCNPFDKPTLRAVFDTWRERYEDGEEDIRILYVNMRNVSEVRDVLAAQDWLRPVIQDKRFVLLAPRVDGEVRNDGDRDYADKIAATVG